MVNTTRENLCKVEVGIRERGEELGVHDSCMGERTSYALSGVTLIPWGTPILDMPGCAVQQGVLSWQKLHDRVSFSDQNYAIGYSN